MKNKVRILVMIVFLVLSMPTFILAQNLYNPNGLSFNLYSSALTSNGTIPLNNVCSKQYMGKDMSVPLSWSGGPQNTKSYAIFMYDLNPIAKNYVHWAVINIPSNINEIKEGASMTLNMPKGAIELTNSSGRFGYAPPCPPANTGVHQYKLILYALSTNRLTLSAPTTIKKFQAALEGNVLASSELSGYFGK
jgi:Raf kinase inhibitor-like YbhB/YbcL family protein